MSSQTPASNDTDRFTTAIPKWYYQQYDQTSSQDFRRARHSSQRAADSPSYRSIFPPRIVRSKA
jgi:hypothetical protein